MRLYHFLLLPLVLTLIGCAGDLAHREGMGLLAEGKPEQGIAKLEEAVKRDPDQVQFRMDLQTQRNLVVSRLLSEAANERGADHLDQAEQAYRRVLTFDQTNERARAGLDGIERERRHRPLLEKAAALLDKEDTEDALAVLRVVEAENPSNPQLASLKRRIEEVRTKQELASPILRSATGKPINLEFRDANPRIIFEAISRAAGVNFILDKDIKPDLRTTIFLRQSSLDDAVELLLQTNRLDKKVLNRNTVLIYPNTPEKQKDYQELVVKGFYLANANVKETQAMLKSLLKTRDTFIDEKLNLLVIRDAPEAVRMAERLIAMQDLSEPEVMLEVEVMEVLRSRLLNLGIQWPNQLTLYPLPTGTSLTLGDIYHLNSSRVGATISNTVVNLNRELGDTNILANPRIRVKNHEKARIMIGDKLPVFNTTSTATGLISENTQYLDVGLKLDVEPTISLQDEVSIRIGLEVSSIVNQVVSKNGTTAYQIGSRNASTMLRLKDGETQILAGLINDQDQRTAAGIPGLADLPILGRLFGTQKDDRQKTEIVLSITPRIVRNLARPDAHSGEFWSGTETLLRSKPLRMAEPTIASATPSATTDVPITPSVGTAPPQSTYDGATTAGSGKLVLQWLGPASVRVGEQFSVSLIANAEQPIRSLPFQFGFDPAIFQVINIKEGTFFVQDGGKVNLSSQTDPNGKSFVGIARSGGDGARGEGTVATVTLRAVAAKPSAEIRLIAVNPVPAGELPVRPQLPEALTIAVKP